MDLSNLIKQFYKTPEQLIVAEFIINKASQCTSIVEFGTKGGVLALACFQGLILNKQKWKPRYCGIDLAEDESILTLHKLAEAVGISFQFIRHPTKNYPIHETDMLIWDTFHCAGNLLLDLLRMGPNVKKYIIIKGVQTNGDHSEAVNRKLDVDRVATELEIDRKGAELGLKNAIQNYISRDNNWNVEIMDDYAVLTRNTLFKSRVFAT
jgi:hypothetical protein